MKNRKIRTRFLFELIGVDYFHYNNALRKGRNPTILDPEIVEQLTAEIQKIRVDFRNFFDRLGDRDRLTPDERKKLDEILTDPRVSTASILGAKTARENKFRERVFSRKNGRSTLYSEKETAYARERVAVFLLETQL